MNALSQMMNNLYLTSARISDIRALKPLLIALEYPHIDDPSQCHTMLNGVLVALDRASVEMRELVTNWFEDLNSPERYLRYLGIFRQFMTLRFYDGAIEDSRIAARTLDLLYRARRVYPEIPLSEFYNDALNEDYMDGDESVFAEIKLWRLDMKAGPSDLKKSFISFPFLLSPSTKAAVLGEDARIQMQLKFQQAYRSAIQLGQRSFVPYLILNVRRSHLVEDTLMHMTFEHAGDDLKKPLKVIFDGEDGVDAGGVKKEFFQIVTRELLDPSFGMFKIFEESRFLWFNSDSFESNNEYELIGKLLGVAIYNSVIIDLKMPSLIYKKLKKQPLALADLEELHPQLAKGLRSLLEFTGDVKSTFEQNFQITYERYGENVVVDLKEGGSEIFVDENNRIEYVELYVDYILTSSVRPQYDAFERGFLSVCGGRALDLFDYRELELLICGNPSLQLEVKCKS